MSHSPQILLVEDDPALGFVMLDGLTRKNYTVTLCTKGDEALTTFHQGKFDACILDIMLPARDGLSVAKAMRDQDSRIPILFVTARSMMEDKVRGFQSGGDDYITKPFEMEELCLRLEVFLRRNAEGQALPRAFALGSYEFNYDTLHLQHPAASRKLTQKEGDILRLLCENRHRILKREELLKAIWGDDDYFMGRSMDVFISRLRKALRHDSRIQILNHHGIGFKLEIP